MLLLLLLLLLLLDIAFMQGIYSYMPDTDNVSSIHNFAAILWLYYYYHYYCYYYYYYYFMTKI